MRSGLELMAARVAGLPAVLEETLDAPCVVPARWLGLPIVATGAGLAEGPARWLVEVLLASGRPARFVSLSAFAAGEVAAPGALLVLFSQGLSPNALIALELRHAFADCALVTAVRGLSKQGVCVFTHPPEDEAGMLVRLQGPAAATLMAARLASALGALPAPGPETVAALRRASVGEEVVGGWALAESAAFLGAGGFAALCHGLAWTWMEGLWVPAPPLWDVLQFAHGPFQSSCARPLTLVALERDHHASDRALFDRLAQMVRPHQRLVRLRATLPGPLAVLEHGAQLARWMLRLLEAAPPRDLDAWPGRGEDAPLYGLSAPLDPVKAGAAPTGPPR